MEPKAAEAQRSVFDLHSRILPSACDTAQRRIAPSEAANAPPKVHMLTLAYAVTGSNGIGERLRDEPGARVR